MRIFLLANNRVGLQIAEFLKKDKEDIVALAVHNPDKQRYTQEIIHACKIKKNNIFFAKELRNPQVIKKIKKIEPDIIIAAFWGYILKPEIIQLPLKGCINFHPGYLPYNRGMNPNVWPIVEGTPAGVTLHYIDDGIDTGDIVSRKKVKVEPFDTAETLYDKTLIEIVDLFKKTWPVIKHGKVKRISQKMLKKSTFHWAKDISLLDRIDLDKTYSGRELINILRARSYSDRYYAYFEEEGKKIYVRLQLSEKI